MIDSIKSENRFLRDDIGVEFQRWYDKQTTTTTQQTLPYSITQVVTFNDKIHAHDTRNRCKPRITQRRIYRLYPIVYIIKVLKSGTQSRKKLAQ